MEQQSSPGSGRAVPGPLAQEKANEWAEQAGMPEPYPAGPAVPVDWDERRSGWPAPAWPSGILMPNLRAVAVTAVTGHRACQDACELAVALATASLVSPTVYLEIGTYAGGTAWAFANLPTVDVVISVDTDPQADAVQRLADIPCTAYQLGTDSHHYETLARSRAILEGRPVDVLLLDGGRDYGSVRDDWELYRTLVRPGGLVMLAATQPHTDRPDIEVHRLWGQIEEQWRTTEITANPGEYGGIGLVWV